MATSRRGFLKGLAGLAAVAAAASVPGMKLLEGAKEGPRPKVFDMGRKVRPATEAELIKLIGERREASMKELGDHLDSYLWGDFGKNLDSIGGLKPQKEKWKNFTAEYSGSFSKEEILAKLKAAHKSIEFKPPLTPPKIHTTPDIADQINEMMGVPGHMLRQGNGSSISGELANEAQFLHEIEREQRLTSKEISDLVTDTLKNLGERQYDVSERWFKEEMPSPPAQLIGCEPEFRGTPIKWDAGCTTEYNGCTTEYNGGLPEAKYKHKEGKWFMGEQAWGIASEKGDFCEPTDDYKVFMDMSYNHICRDKRRAVLATSA